MTEQTETIQPQDPAAETVQLDPVVTMDICKGLAFQGTLPHFMEEVKANFANVDQALAAKAITQDIALQACFGILGQTLVHSYINKAMISFLDEFQKEVDAGKSPVEAFQGLVGDFINPELKETLSQMEQEQEKAP